jgi:hypothetical protein
MTGGKLEERGKRRRRRLGCFRFQPRTEEFSVPQLFVVFGSVVCCDWSGIREIRRAHTHTHYCTRSDQEGEYVAESHRDHAFFLFHMLAAGRAGADRPNYDAMGKYRIGALW